MSNENENADLLKGEEKDLDLEEAEKEAEGVDDKKDDEGDKSKKSDKKEFTPEDKLAYHQRMVDKLSKKTGTKNTVENQDKGNKSEGLGYAEKAYLIANGVKGADEIKLVSEFMENTGKTLDEIVESKFFQSELKELREAKATANAIPKGTKRSGQTQNNEVDYWLAKGELPPNTPENQKLRRDVVEARYKMESTGSKFASNPTGKVARQK